MSSQKPPTISRKDLANFLDLSQAKCFKERWVVTNEDAVLDKLVNTEAHPITPVKLVSLKTDLLRQKQLIHPPVPEPAIHTADGQSLQTRDSMQQEAIADSVRILREQYRGPSGTSARGKIILPCGTGKSRIALRIIEELTETSEISVVLCPSIALIAQLRLEFLSHAKKNMRMLSVCSDPSVVDRRSTERSIAQNPMADIGMTCASEIKGTVTTDPNVIGEWMMSVAENLHGIGVIFGTYQSSHKIAESLKSHKVRIAVMVADEAHRTAGLKRIPKEEQKLKNFTVCHHEENFPCKYRIYQTATPKVFTSKTGKTKNREL